MSKDNRAQIDALLDDGTTVGSAVQMAQSTQAPPPPPPPDPTKPAVEVEPDHTESGLVYGNVPGYVVKDGCLWQYGKNGALMKLSTFTAIPRKIVTKDDGQTVQTGFEVDGFDSLNRKLGSAWVTSSEFARMEWPVSNWGFEANILPGSTNKDKMRYAIAEVGKHTARKETLYTHTGWRQLGGKWVYLHGGGAIGAEAVSVQLEGRLVGYDMSVKDAPDIMDAVMAETQLMTCMKPAIGWSVLGMSYLAPLTEFLEARGIAPRFALYLMGATQTRKTTAALLALSHFGNFNGQVKIPASFNDTANSVQRSAFLMKDMPLLIDDYYPVGNVQERRRMEAMAQTLARSFGNGSSRGRLNSDMTQRAGLPPRGVAIITGEDAPDIKESGLARFFIVPVRRGDIPADGVLTATQELAAKGYLVTAMTGYIRWLAEQADSLPDLLYKRFISYREMAREHSGAGARACEAEAWLLIGAEMMLRYWESLGAVSESDKRQMMTDCRDALEQAAAEQTRDLSEQRPTAQFVEIVRELLASATNKCISVDETSNSINVIGFADANFYYFMPELTYRAVNKFCADQGSAFPLALNALKKMLVEDRMIGPDMGNKLKKIRGKTGRYLWIPRGVIDGRDEPELVEVQEQIPFEE